MGLVEQPRGNWLKAFDAGTLSGAGTLKVTSEQMELSCLRAEVAWLKRENDILRKATADVAWEVL
jgi:transposase